MASSIFRKKSLEKIVRDAEEGLGDAHGHKLHKVLGVRDLTFMGVAAVIGAGIFSTIGTAAYHGGPGVIFLFLITAITCGFTALCYAEFASRVPVAGSAYTYSYVSFGEVIAWVIGWALILEYAIGNVVVAISWSAYFNNILKTLGVDLPGWLSIGYQTAKMSYESALAAGKPVTDAIWTNAPEFLGLKFIINLPAFIIVVLITMLAYVGINESRKSANFMVGLKLVVLFFIAVVGFYLIFSTGTEHNWVPFLPEGMGGVMQSVSSVFFAYIGFDAISVMAEESKNPQRDLPRSMILSLVICTVVYILLTFVLTGVLNYRMFEGVGDPLAKIFEVKNVGWMQAFVSVAAVIAMTSVLLVFQMGQPRIWMSMSRDGLLPPAFERIHPKFQTPSFSTIVTGLLVGVPILFTDKTFVLDFTSIATLFAFVLVCGGILLIPRKEKVPGKFNMPYVNSKYIFPLLVMCAVILIKLANKDYFSALFNVTEENASLNVSTIILWIVLIILAIASYIKSFSLIPLLGLSCCLYLLTGMTGANWAWFGSWLALGLIFYFSYGYKKSRLAKQLI